MGANNIYFLQGPIETDLERLNSTLEQANHDGPQARAAILQRLERLAHEVDEEIALLRSADAS